MRAGEQIYNNDIGSEAGTATNLLRIIKQGWSVAEKLTVTMLPTQSYLQVDVTKMVQSTKMTLVAVMHITD